MYVVHETSTPNVQLPRSSNSPCTEHSPFVQSALVLDSLRLACDFLRPEGTFVTKIFRSRDYTALLYAFRQLFARVDATKPQASRATSAEIFVVCSGYKAPAKIDPRLLDQRSLFQVLSCTQCICARDLGGCTVLLCCASAFGPLMRTVTGPEALMRLSATVVDEMRSRDYPPST